MNIIPDQIEIGLGSKCNLRCPLCTRNKKFYIDSVNDKFNNELDFDKLIEFLILMRPKEIKLVGAICEPTLYYKFIELLEWCSNNNISIWLSTNGSTKNKSFWEKVAIAIPNGSTINIDIDHTDSIKQTTYRRGSNLTKILSHIYILKSSKKQIEINALRIDFNWNKDNFEEFKDTAVNIWGIGVYNIPCYNFSEMEFYEDTTLWSHPKQILYNKLDNLNSGKLFKNEKITCEALTTNSIYVNYLGDILPCCYINDLILKEDSSLFNTDKSIRVINFPKIYSIMNLPTKEVLIKNYYETINAGVNKNNIYPDLCLTCAKFCTKSKRKMFNVLGLDP